MRRSEHGKMVKMATAVKNSKEGKGRQQGQGSAQAARGKVTTRCLWNACKALSVGLLLLGIGTTMAVIGYYADQLSIRSETRGNFTVRIKNESRGFHLNNLSYAGPIVMGIGGFIVVAACVMTFEARDNAAKVVPARFKPNLNSSLQAEGAKSTPRNSRTFQRGATGVQTPTRLGSTDDWFPKNDPNGRKAFTAAFVWFSRELMEKSTAERNHRWRRKMSEGGLSKSPSAPDLARAQPAGSCQGTSGNVPRRLPPKTSPRAVDKSQCEPLRPQETVSNNLLLRPSHLQRQALSVDNPFYEYYDCFTPPSMRLSRQRSRRSEGSGESVEMELGSSAGVSGSQVSMALDLHECQVTLKVKDESANKRSDTAKRHQLLRQKPVEDDRDVLGRCSCVTRFYCAPSAEECAVRTKSSVNLKSLCPYCAKTGGSCCGRVPVPRITADLRSQSFSQTEPRKCADHGKIFCIEAHRKKANLSSENLWICCECGRKRSPGASPRNECRAQGSEGSECLVHSRTKNERRPLVRNNANRRKSSQKMEGSLSAEEQNLVHCGKTVRSASFSPTGRQSTSGFSSRNDSCREGSPRGGSRFPTAEDSANDDEKPETEEPP